MFLGRGEWSQNARWSTERHRRREAQTRQRVSEWLLLGGSRWNVCSVSSKKKKMLKTSGKSRTNKGDEDEWSLCISGSWILTNQRCWWLSRYITSRNFQHDGNINSAGLPPPAGPLDMCPYGYSPQTLSLPLYLLQTHTHTRSHIHSPRTKETL